MLDRQVVGLGAGGEHLVRPQGRVVDRVRVDAVDADAVLAPFERGHARQLIHCRLGRGVGRRAGTGCRHVLGADHHDAAAARRELQQRVTGLHHQQVRFHVDGHRLAPHVARDFLHRLRGGEDAGIKDQHVDAAKVFDGFVDCFSYFFYIGKVANQSKIIRPLPHGFDRRVQIETHHRRTTLEQCFGAGLADTRGGASDDGHLAGKGGRAARLLQLRLFQVPVFDVEGVLVRECFPAAQRFSAQDHFDGVLVKVFDDADVLGGTAERGQAEFRIQRHARRRIEHGLGFLGRLGVLLEIIPVGSREAGDIPSQHRQRLGADHVVRRRRPALRYARDLGMARETEEIRRIVAAAEHRETGRLRHLVAQLGGFLALEGACGLRRQAHAPGLLCGQVLLRHRNQLDH